MEEASEIPVEEAKVSPRSGLKGIDIKKLVKNKRFLLIAGVALVLVLALVLGLVFGLKKPVYTVTFEVEGGEPIVLKVKKGEDLVALSGDKVTVPEGFRFDKWDKAFDSITGNLIVTAQYIAIDYSITYSLDDGTNDANNPATYTIEDEEIVFEDASKDGYAFLGWFDAAVDGIKVETIAKGSTGNIDLYARWEATGYSITYNLDGGTNDSSNPATYTIEEAVTFEPATKVGYALEGWFDADTGGEEVIGIELKSTGDLAIYARWETIDYSITYNLNDGTNDSSNPATYTIEDAVTFEPATKTGYTFLGWFDADIGGTQIETIAKGSTGDNVLYARWEVTDYSITYNLDGGTNHANNPVTYTFEDEEIAFEDASKDGYTFLGWFDAATEGTKVVIIAKGSTGNIDLYARWEVIEYTVSYENTNGVSNSNPTTYTVEDTPLPLVALEGTVDYTFAGWYLDDVYFENLVTELSVDLEDVTLYAKWANYGRVNELGEVDADGEYIMFGEYPQTIKDSNTVITEEQDSRGYYKGDDDYYYAMVVADPYGSGSKFSTNELIVSDEIYYFKVEPIKWRILEESNGEVLMLCESVIESKRFNAYYAGLKDGYYANSYINSEIREWLNDEFFATAFEAIQQELIQETQVDNSISSTGYKESDFNYDIEEYMFEDTNDKIFLLSYSELTLYFNTNIARTKVSSDYAKAVGVQIYRENSKWWSRSPSIYSAKEETHMVRHVNFEGKLTGINVRGKDSGVVPALRIKLS